MEKYFDFLLHLPLFRGIQLPELPGLLHCLQAQKISFEKGTFIFLQGDAVTNVALVLSGSVLVSKDDIFGNRSIIGHLEAGAILAETFVCAGVQEMPVEVSAASSCCLLFLDYRRLITMCPSACGHHGRLIENMLFILAQKNLSFSEKIEHLSRRTTRGKLHSYLLSEAKKHGSMHFSIPFNRQELADYLCVDRSAMSWELGKMRDLGLLSFHRSHFTLHDGFHHHMQGVR